MRWLSRSEQRAEAARLVSPGNDVVLTAAATTVTEARRGLIPQYDSWQREVWDFFDELGEFRYAVTWLAGMTSRMRLRAARQVPDQDEPTFLDDGIAAELVEDLAGGVGGQAELLNGLAVQLLVPGEGYLVGETRDGDEDWKVKSIDEMRVQSDRWQTVDEKSTTTRIKWRDLADDSLVVRVHRPHPRFHHVADSPARAARSIMRELELVNRHIQAQYLSRLASAGLFVMADEVSFPVREEFQDAADPFMREMIETAAQAIKTPGTAASVLPIMMRVPAEYIEKFKLFDFTLKIDDRIIEKRESATKRLATELDVPAEILLGLGTINHWGQFAIEEQAVKAHIVPTSELIVHSLTTGYLHPRLRALGEDVDGLVVWYDLSEITIRPDRSVNAVQAYDRFELSGRAMRREVGFDEADTPTDDELRSQILKTLARNPQVGFNALSELIDERIEGPQPPKDEVDVNRPPAGEIPVPGPPDTRDEPAPGPDVAAQASAMHALAVGLDQSNGGWMLLHPSLCKQRLSTCPVTIAAGGLRHYPATSGHYECRLSPIGDLVIGQRIFPAEDDFVPGWRNGVDART